MVKDADYVYVLESGRVIEAGTSNELIVAGGRFTGFATGVSNEEDSKDTMKTLRPSLKTNR